jgi:hypothetical protein
MNPFSTDFLALDPICHDETSVVDTSIVGT